MRKALQIISIIAVLAISIFLILGCSSGKSQKYMLDKEDASQERVKQQTGVANPATLHCLNTTGATWQVREGTGGEYGVCTFSDGTQCEEWAYYNGHCAQGDDMTLCEGQFWGKTTCPNDYSPVCGYLNTTDSWENFNNACKACLVSEGNAKGYRLGAC